MTFINCFICENLLDLDILPYPSKKCDEHLDAAWNGYAINRQSRAQVVTNHSLLQHSYFKKAGLRGFRPGLKQTGQYSESFGLKKKRNCTIHVAKTKALISFTVSHAVAHIRLFF